MRAPPSKGQDFDAAFRDATALHQGGRHAEAVAAYESLLLQSSEDPQLLYQLGAAYAELNRFNEAVSALERSLRNRPDHLPTVEMMGSALIRSGQPEKSVEFFQRADQLSGGTAATTARLANAQRLAGKFSDAAENYRRLLAQDPEHRQSMVGLAICLATTQDVASAERLLRACLQQHRDYSPACVTLAALLGQTERFAEAEEVLRDHLARNPGNIEARRTLGSAVHKQGRLLEAEAIYGEILREAFDAQTALQRAEALIDLNRLGEAEALLVALKNGSSPASPVLTNLGRIEELRGNLEAAVALHTSALDYDPLNANALVNRGSAYRFAGNFEKALADYDSALSVQPDFPPAIANRGLTLLILGRLREAWPHYRSRIKALPGALDLSLDRPWNGSSLIGKRVLVWLEYGLGDEILFASLIPEIIQVVAHCTIVCAPRLLRLFRRSFPDATVIAMGDPIEGEFDFRLALTDAAEQLRPSLDDFPKHDGYLKPDAALTKALREKYLAGRHRRLVGLSWKSASGPSGRFKSTSLTQWREILRQPDATFVSLQYGDIAEDIACLSDLGIGEFIQDRDVDPAGDLDQFAAQVAAMDLVLSVSNTTVHVAGALARPTWALVPKGPGAHWYWFLQRADNPWYPTLRLFRQEQPGDWRAPFEKIAIDYSKWLQS